MITIPKLNRYSKSFWIRSGYYYQNVPARTHAKLRSNQVPRTDLSHTITRKYYSRLFEQIEETETRLHIAVKILLLTTKEEWNFAYKYTCKTPIFIRK